jgi:hypothetical protein
MRRYSRPSGSEKEHFMFQRSCKMVITGSAVALCVVASIALVGRSANVQVCLNEVPRFVILDENEASKITATRRSECVTQSSGCVDTPHNSPGCSPTGSYSWDGPCTGNATDQACECFFFGSHGTCNKRPPADCGTRQEGLCASGKFTLINAAAPCPRTAPQCVTIY